MTKPRNKEEYRAELADAFADILEEKGLQWRKEWSAKGGAAPHNGITKACYRGTNAFWLSLISMVKGYNDPRWVTMVQIMDKQGKYHPKQKWHLKAGSKATYVEYWYPFDTKNHKALTWDDYKTELASGRRETEFVLSTKYTAVFNAHDVEGMPQLQIAQRDPISEDELISKVSAGMGVQILLDGGDRAYYSPSEDRVHLPTPESFTSVYAFNSTGMHELAHASGHPSRLNRDMAGRFGDAAYAYEELVAEICSCLMGADMGEEISAAHIENHKAYVQGWIQVIRDKPETLVRAIKDAQAAANYMDWKAGLMTDLEYAKSLGSVMEVAQKPRSRDLAR